MAQGRIKRLHRTVIFLESRHMVAESLIEHITAKPGRGHLGSSVFRYGQQFFVIDP